MAANPVPSITDLFHNAQQDGILSPHSFQALQVLDLGEHIQAGLGIPAQQVMASEVVLVTIMPDDSGSIRYGKNVQAVRGGHNAILDVLLSTKQHDSILIHTRYLNGFVLYPYSPLDQAIRMDRHNYDPQLGTPLYDQTMVLLGTVLAKTQEFSDNGIPVRSITLIITDGCDSGSCRANAQSVASLVQDMLNAENHIVAAMGIADGCTDFKQVFRAMGIRDEWILTPGSNESDIRKAFQVFSQSAVGVSQSMGGLGGFASP
jgi:hypothetical protein